MQRSILATILLLVVFSCSKGQTDTQKQIEVEEQESRIYAAAELPEEYIPFLKNKRTALVVNHTSLVDTLHLVDFLLGQGISVKKIFAPEHGFRGKADAGEELSDTRDRKTGLPIVSLYGSNKKPKPEDLQDVDVVVFDIQDVGTRFFTYISTMHYVMEACAENDKSVLVLDRPNPNGFYVDGPVLKKEFTSFVGMHPIPVVHGLTVGELARMINGEGWLTGGKKCDLTVAKMKNYDHTKHYSLPVKPSPNLPNDKSINLYPSTCFFEGTQLSIGRGTEFPFQAVGYPNKKYGDFTFTPRSIEGMSKNPPFENQLCYGLDLRDEPFLQRINLTYVINCYKKWEEEKPFFIKYFDTLAGTDELKKQIIAGKSEDEIRASWQKELMAYKSMRKKYLLYKDFE